MDPDDNLLFLLSSAHWNMHKLLRKRFKEKKIPITPDQWLILYDLNVKGSMFQHKLAESQYKDKSAIKRLIDHLETRNLVNRSKSKSDKRKKLIQLTGEGASLIKDWNRIAKKTFERSCYDLSEVEFNALKRLIKKIELNK